MRSLLIKSVGISTLLLVSHAQAQFAEQLRVGNYSAGFRSTSSQILGRPTISPYLALTDLNGQGNVDTSRNYFTQVRPQLDRQAQSQTQQIQLQNIQRNVTQMRSEAARRSVSGPRGTGHPTRFGYYLQYYPTLNRR